MKYTVVYAWVLCYILLDFCFDLGSGLSLFISLFIAIGVFTSKEYLPKISIFSRFQNFVESLNKPLSVSLFILLILILTNPTEGRFSRFLGNKNNDIKEDIYFQHHYFDSAEYFKQEGLPENLQVPLYDYGTKLHNYIIFSTYETCLYDYKRERVVKRERYNGIMGIFNRIPYQ